MLKRYIGTNTNMAAAITILLAIIASAELFIATSSLGYSKRQEKIEAIVFTRENINGYTYLYGQFMTHEVFLEITKIRDAGLPAIAVPSQYGDRNQWLIIAPSFGSFLSQVDAEDHILDWRQTILTKGKGDDKVMEFRAELLENYRKRLQVGADRANLQKLVLFYKADIVNWGRYFQDLAISDLLYVDPKKAVSSVRKSSGRWGI